MTEDLYREDCIRTRSGIYMNVFEPTPEMISIEDIAHALSNISRWGGHSMVFYSVAQHSVLCAAMASDSEKLAALLHDASEAYLMDIPSPIKKRLPQYKVIEDNLMKVIAQKFGFEYPLSYHIKVMDKALLHIEWEEIMIPESKDQDFICWTPELAKVKFLEMYHRIIRTPSAPPKCGGLCKKCQSNNCK